MNRLNHKYEKVWKELQHLCGLAILWEESLGLIDPSTRELIAKLEEEVWYFVIIRGAIRKGYKRVEE